MNEMTESYTKAVILNNRIIANAQAAQMSLYEVCKGLKEMRDGKLYKELGYQNFEEYCETEVGIKRVQAYRYISVAEKFGSDFVYPGIQKLGIKKLYLLSTLSENEREELTERLGLENTTTRELKSEIDQLKAEKAQKECELQEIHTDRDKLQEQVTELEQQVRELESRPIEVTAVSESHEVENMRLAMNKNSAEWGRRYDALQEENLARERELHQSYKRQMDEQKAWYEKQLCEAQAKEQSGTADETAVFKAYFSIAYQAFQNLVQFTQQAQSKQMMQTKIRKLTDTVLQSLEG